MAALLSLFPMLHAQSRDVFAIFPRKDRAIEEIRKMNEFRAIIFER